MTNPPHILVVDDEERIQSLVGQVLEEEGFRVECAGDADSAIQAIDRDTPHLVLLDIRMPGKDGYHVLKHINQRQLGIPVIFLTGESDTSEIAQGLSLGAEDYVTKPFSTQVLLARVKGILRRTGGNTKL